MFGFIEKNGRVKKVPLPKRFTISQKRKIQKMKIEGKHKVAKNNRVIVHKIGKEELFKALGRNV